VRGTAKSHLGPWLWSISLLCCYAPAIEQGGRPGEEPYEVTIKFYKTLEEFESPGVPLADVGEADRYRPGSPVWIPDDEVARLRARGALVPIEGLRVVLVDGNRKVQGRTDGSGRVRFELISGRTYYIRVYFGTHEWFRKVFLLPFWVGMLGKVEGEETKSSIERSIFVSPSGDIRRRPY